MGAHEARQQVLIVADTELVEAYGHRGKALRFDVVAREAAGAPGHLVDAVYERDIFREKRWIRMHGHMIHDKLP